AQVAGARATAAQAAAAIAEQTRLAAAQNRLTTVRSTLDSASATVTSALTPAQTRRSLAARAGEAPLLALVEAAGSGYPQGYAASGSLLTGLASWYGPGFVGSPTASGTPYDPERLTCAHKTLPLRTVLRVSANGRSVSCLVNDRGPYVGPRILDLSRAGSRALGFDGVQQVTIEILAPAPPSP
ncbi:MAG: septal ring lytic transglycosylase RlpA family protein, partial [Actinomycetota bacterium]|nr:septal ring lytic transglycosylase RlpA family protein [Actinomycetota bacterium]